MAKTYTYDKACMLEKNGASLARLRKLPFVKLTDTTVEVPLWMVPRMPPECAIGPPAIRLGIRRNGGEEQLHQSSSSSVDTTPQADRVRDSNRIRGGGTRGDCGCGKKKSVDST